MLPRVDTDEEWDAIVPDEAVMRPGAAALCARLGVRAGPLSRFPTGSQPVYAVGDRYVLKLFPAAAAADGIAEARVLAHLQGRLPVPTPYVHDAGECENGWRYVLMSRLRGTDLAVAWPRIPAADQDRIATEAGETLAALHALDPAPLADVLGPGDWGPSPTGSAARRPTGSAPMTCPNPGWHRSPASSRRRHCPPGRPASCCTPSSCVSI